MGVVYRAFDRVLRRDVALKTMSAPSDDDKAQTVRFLREARTAGALHHPNIVTVHELGQHEGTYFIAMELLEGHNLREQIDSGRFPPIRRRLEIVARICDGLDYAHRAGIVHRDIKPANVYLGTAGSIKILDFGIAKISDSGATRTGMLIGTVDYMSPEQVRALKTLDGRSDIFSAGVILYELLFRRRPFTAGDLGATLHRILHHQPPGSTLFDQVLCSGLADVLRRSLDKRREARFARAGEMAEALDRIAETLRGRAATELEERIEQVIGSGVLESKDNEPPVAGISDSRLARTAAHAAQAPTAGSRGMRLLLASVAIAVLAVAGWLGTRRLGSRPEAPVAAEIPLTAPATEPSAASTSEEPAAPAVEVDPAAAAPVEPAPEAGAEAVVEPVRPLPPPRRATLNVLVMPWANVRWIENLDSGERIPGEATTPARIALPEGRYRLRLANPYVPDPIDIETEVRADRINEVRRTLPGFDAASLAGEILSGEGVNAEGGER